MCIVRDRLRVETQIETFGTSVRFTADTGTVAILWSETLEEPLPQDRSAPNYRDHVDRGFASIHFAEFKTIPDGDIDGFVELGRQLFGGWYATMRCQ